MATILAERASLDRRPVPRWYTDAKLGIFVHWGLYSIPAFAERTDGDYTAFMRDLTAGKDTRGRVPYAEFYLNALRVPGSATARYHQATYGPDVSYFDLRDRFERSAATVDLGEWARCFAGAGARYVVMVARHLDGYPLWPTKIANPHMPVDYRSRRDLVADLSEAVRALGPRMGLYYGGGLDWSFTDKPIRTMADLMRQQALGPEYARYATAQWTELIDTYQPSVLWNDMGWPAESDPHQLIAHYYDTVADGVVNDRWTQVRLPANRLVRELYLRFVSLTLKALARAGRSLPNQPQRVHADFQTHEYATPDPAPTTAWELTRGLGRSFGYNAKETAADTLTGTQLVHLLAEVVAHGGNLLINVGPDGAGHIPDLQQRPLRELGAWLDRNGDAIYATRPWSTAATTTADGHQVRYTQKDGTVFAIVLADQLTGTLTVRGLTLPPGSRVGILDGPGDLAWVQTATGVRITPPPQPPGRHAHVLTITTDGQARGRIGGPW
jgi:alpha-L-fucosidase